MRFPEGVFERLGLRSILAISMLLIFCASLAVFVNIDREFLKDRGQEALVDEARIFADEMDAVWEFMEYARNSYGDDREGFYAQSNLYCSIVGKGVGAIFSADGDHTIRYTNFDPRNYLDRPDAFEARALNAFNEDASCDEYYGIADFEGEETFRYLRALEVSESCLDCHGSPAGEIDVTGHEKEGWTLWSVGGAISIVMPLDAYEASLEEDVRNDTLYVLAGSALACIIIYVIVSIFIFRPLDQVKESFNKIKRGDFSALDGKGFRAKEIRELANSLNDMACDLQVLYSHLEDQVVDRTHALTLANDELEQLNDRLVREIKYKSDFLSMVSHELRTPLTSILVFTQLLRDEAARNHDDKERSSWVEIEKNCHILLGMINNMLDMARFDAGTANAFVDLMDIGDLATSVKAVAYPLAKTSGVEFVVRVGPSIPLVVGDYEKTLRMLENLVNNAIKFTPEGGEILLDIAYDPVSCVVDLKVVDTGIGIAEADQKRIFERFVQLDAGVTRKFGGSGLGLSLVREYAELQGYEVLVESALGEGSTFVVRIPVKRQKADAMETENKP